MTTTLLSAASPPGTRQEGDAMASLSRWISDPRSGSGVVPAFSYPPLEDASSRSTILQFSRQSLADASTKTTAREVRSVEYLVEPET